MRQVPKITEMLGKKFTISVEVVPPRNGASMDDVFRELCYLRYFPIDFMSVTMGAAGSLRGGSIVLAKIIQDQLMLPCISHVVCRDHTQQQIENLLMDLHWSGIKNILALLGDVPVGSKRSETIQAHPFAYKLVEQIRRLNSGEYLKRDFDNPTNKISGDFCIGVASYPNSKGEERDLSHKINAGADFTITQMCFSIEQLKNLPAGSLPVIPGIKVFSNIKTADFCEKHFGIVVPEELKALLRTGDEKEIVNWYRDYIQELKKFFPGVHIFVIKDLQIVGKVLETIC